MILYPTSLVTVLKTLSQIFTICFLFPTLQKKNNYLQQWVLEGWTKEYVAYTGCCGSIDSYRAVSDIALGIENHTCYVKGQAILILTLPHYTASKTVFIHVEILSST